MKRAYYFWIAAILALAFGLLMLFAPAFAATQFQLAGSPATATIFRVLGSVMLGVALLNFLVRNHAMSETLRSVLWTNAAIHGVGFAADLWSVGLDDVPLAGVVVGLVAHVIVFAGAAYYLWRPGAP
ncbi:MAG TPA: hypothetical protein VG757_12175 [Devosia sp.]|nr:hypothetical protein [Devosia sp.]